MSRTILSFAARVILAAAMFLLLSPNSPAQRIASRHVSELTELNQSLLDTNRKAALASQSQRPMLTEELIDIARRRREMLRELIVNSPNEAVQTLLPQERVEELPETVRQYVESRFSAQGILDVLAEDIPHEPRMRFFFNHEGEKLELLFVGDPPEVATGSEIQVLATKVDDVLLLSSGGENGTPSQEMQVVANVLPNTFGVQNTAVVLVNFQDNNTQPYSVSDVNNVVFGSVNGFLQENSSYQTSLAGNVFGYFTLPMSISSCDFNKMTALADAAAAGGGVDLSGYQRIIYVSPLDPSCGWEGAAYVGGLPSRAWINGVLALEVVAHELGHNFGLLHSHALNCNGSTLGDACQTIEYGDLFDVMGHTTSAHYNAFQKERLGWLNFGSSPPITTVTASGSYVLAPYSSASAAIKALKLFKAVDSTSGIVTNYYVEFRQPIGFDNDLTAFPASTQGVVVHTGSLQNAGSSQLLDMNPQTPVFDDAALGVGQTFKDPASGVSLTTVSVSPTQAVVSVILAPPACVLANPGALIIPLQSTSVSAGTTVVFNVTVTSNDSATCNLSVFHLRPFLPNNFSATFGQSDLVIAPGGSATTTMSITSPVNAASGAYSFSAFVSNGGYAWLAGATYNVNSGGTFSLSASPTSISVTPSSSNSVSVSTSVAGGFSSSVSLSASNLPAGIVANFSPSSLSAPGSGTTTATFTAGAMVAIGSYAVTISAVGGGRTFNTTVTLLVGTSAPPPSTGASPSPISQSGWRLVKADSAETFCGNYPATNAFDGSANTIWQTQYCPSSSGIPHEIQIDLGSTYNVAGFRYLPRQDGVMRGSIKSYEFYVSNDGTNWGTPVSVGVLVTTASDISQKQVFFSIPVIARYIRLRALSAADGGPWSSVAELNILASANSDSGPSVFSVSLTPNTVTGGSIVNGTVMLNASAPAGGAQVVLTSNLPNVANPIGPLTIPQSQSSGSFTVSTLAVATTTRVTITATYNNSFAKANVTLNSQAQPDFAVSASPTALTIAPGGSASSTLTATISGGFSSAISFSASGVPAGVTATFSLPTMAAPGQGSSSLLINVSASVATGTYPITVVGSGGGLNRLSTVTLIVSTAPPAPPSATAIPKVGWRLVSVDSAENFCGTYAGSNAFDGNSATIWQTQYCVGSPNVAHDIVIDLGAVYDVAGFNYLPRQDGVARGKIKNYELYLSLDGQNWGTAASAGILISTPSDAAQKQVMFGMATSTRYVKLRALSEVNGGPWSSMAELDLLK